MRGVKQLIKEMEESKRNEFKNLNEKFTYAWLIRLLLEIIERMDNSRMTLTEEEMLEIGGIDGIADKLRESLGYSSIGAGEGTTKGDPESVE